MWPCPCLHFRVAHRPPGSLAAFSSLPWRGASASHCARLGNGLLLLFWVLPQRPGLSGKRGGCPSFRDTAEGTAGSLQSPQTGLSSAHTPWRRPHFPRTENCAKHKTKQTRRRWLSHQRPEWGEDGPQEKGDAPGLISYT